MSQQPGQHPAQAEESSRNPGGSLSRTGPPIGRIALLVVATAALLAAGYCVRSVTQLVPGQRNRTAVTHDVVMQQMRSVARLVSTEATVRDVVVYQDTRLGSTKRTLVVFTGRLMAGIDLDRATVRIDSASRRIAIELPSARLMSAEVLNMRTYDERAGLWNPFTTQDRDAIQRQVRAQLIRAGNETQLLQHANRSASDVLRTLLTRDGYTVDVRIRGVTAADWQIRDQ